MKSFFARALKRDQQPVSRQDNACPEAMPQVPALDGTDSPFLEKKGHVLFLYTIFFIITCLMVFAPFIQTGAGLIWFPDGLAIHHPALAVYGKYLRHLLGGLLRGQLNLSQFDLGLGFGTERLSYVLPNYADPLNMLAVFVPVQYSGYLYSALVVLRMYLAGLSFLAFCFFMNKRGAAALAGALVYTFCSYTFIYAPRHPYFVSAMICLPLLLIGIESVLRRPRVSLVLSAAVCLSIVSNYYFFWMNGLFCAGYFILRFWEAREWKWNWRLFAKSLLAAFSSGLLGLALSAVFLLPNIVLFLNSVRSEGVNLSPWPFFSLYYIGLFIIRLCAPAQTSLMASSAAAHGVIGIGVIGAVIMLTRVREHRALKIGFCVLALGMLLPPFCLMMDGFAGVRSRWSFQFTFLTALMFVALWEKLDELSKRDFLPAFGVAAVYMAGIGFALVFIARGRRFITVNVLGCIDMLLFSAIAVYFAWKKGLRARRTQCLLLAFIVFSAGFSGYMVYAPWFGNYIREFPQQQVLDEHDPDNPLAALLETQKIESGQGEEFYRTEISYATSEAYQSLAGPVPFGPGFAKLYQGLPTLVGAGSTSIFNNVMDKTLGRYMLATGNAGARTPCVAYGLDGRAFLLAANQVKYVLWRDGDALPAPYGFVKERAVPGSTWSVWRNTRFLPLGFTYTDAISEEELMKLTPLQRQEAMLRAVAVRDGEELPDGGRLTTAQSLIPELTSGEIPFRVVDLNGIEKNDGVYTVKSNNAKMTIAFERQANAEYYAAFALKETVLPLSGDPLERDGRVIPLAIPLIFGLDDVCPTYVNLGSKEPAADDSYTISFSPLAKGHSFTADDVQVCVQNMKGYDACVAARSEDTLSGTKIAPKGVTGQITLSRDKYLYLSIPYVKGWEAFVDGKPAPLLHANIAFMAIPLTAGTHRIELRYTTPGLYAGLAVTAAALAVLVFILLRRRRAGRA